MTEAERRRELNLIVTDLVEELDVPASKYEDAKNRYEAVGEWLNDDDSELAQYDPIVYVQGSFALGTAVKPISDEDYDVDVVCLLGLSTLDITQEQRKSIVGSRLKAHRTYAQMLDPREGSRRCWTLKYADESRFHLDILPAIPDDHEWLIALGIPEKLAQHAICITDQKTWDICDDWPKSNPQGYAEWFREQMRVVYEKQRAIVALKERADVQDIPDYMVRTPLQRVIQLLKRHRDVRYNGDDDKPISIIITTLAARAYNNEDELLEALLNVVLGMREAIENRNGVWWVEDPVNPQENFADKWNETTRKREVFLEWLETIEMEHNELLSDSGFRELGQRLTASYGERDTSVVLKKYSKRTGSAIDTTRKIALPIFSLLHRQEPPWPVMKRYHVSISACATREGFRTLNSASGYRTIAKRYSLRFEARTNAPRPFDVHWQVVNTGDEARSKNALRGGFDPGEGNDGLVRKESTLYTGKHWIECFIVKDGQCVARSGEFVVNVE